MENPAHPEGSASHAKCSIKVNMTWQCSVRMWEVTLLPMVGLSYRHYAMKGCPRSFATFTAAILSVYCRHTHSTFVWVMPVYLHTPDCGSCKSK